MTTNERRVVSALPVCDSTSIYTVDFETIRYGRAIGYKDEALNSRVRHLVDMTESEWIALSAAISMGVNVPGMILQIADKRLQPETRDALRKMKLSSTNLIVKA